MKYVLLRSNDGHEALQLVFCVAPLTHRELAAGFSSSTAISAGFCSPAIGGAWRTFGCSESLCLCPGPDDARLISAHVRATLATAPA